jgi:hypothetical protein
MCQLYREARALNCGPPSPAHPRTRHHPFELPDIDPHPDAWVDVGQLEGSGTPSTRTKRPLNPDDGVVLGDEKAALSNPDDVPGLTNERLNARYVAVVLDVVGAMLIAVIFHDRSPRPPDEIASSEHAASHARNVYVELWLWKLRSKQQQSQEGLRSRFSTDSDQLQGERSFSRAAAVEPTRRLCQLMDRYVWAWVARIKYGRVQNQMVAHGDKLIKRQRFCQC